MKSIPTKEDMALLPKLLFYTDPSSVPLSFRYGGQLVRGIPSAFHPTVERRQLDANLLQVIIRGQDEKGLQIQAEYLQYHDYPVTEWLVYFTNQGKEPTSVLSDICIADVVIEGQNPTLVYGNGDTGDEEGYEWFWEKVDHPIDLHPTDGTSCRGAFPYMRLLLEGWGVNIAIGWPTPWKAVFTPAKDGINLKAGQHRTHMSLLPGETMRTPRITLMGFTGGEDRARNLWRRWYFAHILPRENGAPIPPKYCLHNWMAEGMPEFTGANEQNQCGALEDYIQNGLRPDIWWIDAGWYPCDGEWTQLGTWRPDEKRFPNGLAPVGEICQKEGTQFLLWFEPERVRPGSQLYNEHPEWLLQRTMEDGTYYPHILLNLGNKECCDWVIQTVNRIIREGHVSVYRQDFNFDPLPCWIQNEAPDRIGALENLHVQGYLRFWDAILAENPGLWIDSCASGGRRNDLETMRRAVPLHYTDVGYGNHPVKQKQHRQMFEWIPYFRAHNMSWDNPQDGSYTPPTGREVDRFAYHCAMAPAITDMTPYHAPPEAFALAREMKAIWHRAAELMLTGDYYPLTLCRRDPRDFYAMQFHNSDSGQGFFQVLANSQCTPGLFAARLKGLKEGARYRIEDLESHTVKHLTGAQMMTEIPVELPRRTGVIWFYEEEKENSL